MNPSAAVIEDYKEPVNPKALLAPEGFVNKWVDGLTDVEYHADKTSVSSSSLKQVVMISEKTFFHTFFVAGERVPTKPMKFGKLAHLAILEGAKFRERYVVMPEIWGLTVKGERTNSKNSKDVQEKEAKWLADLPVGTIVTTAEECEKLFGMIDSLLSHQKAAEFLSAGIAECSGYYRDPVTGILCRIRPDFMCRQRGIIAELKTADDAREAAFRWQIYGEKYPMWYDFQLAMQAEGFMEIERKPLEVATWIAIQPHGAYEVAVHPMTIPVHDIGIIKYRRALDRLKASLDSGKWPGIQESDGLSFIVPTDHMLEEYGVNYDTGALI